MLTLHHAWSTILNRQTPMVKLCDVRSDTTDLTTYTFTAVNLGDLGSVASIAGDAYGVNPHMRSNGRKMIVVVIHGEDAAVTFGVTSCSIGGVAGTECADRGGGTNAINTATYSWDTNALQGITNTDVVVVWTEAITGCAIGVLSVENIGLAQLFATAATNGTSLITASPSRSLTNDDTFAVAVMGSTNLTSTETATFGSGTGGLCNPMLLYSSDNGEFAYAAAWAYSAQWCGGIASYPTTVGWSGASGMDLVTCMFM